MRCGGMQDEAMSHPRAACTTCSQVGSLQQRPSRLSHYWNPTSDIFSFSDNPYDPPQYEASSLAFFNATRPTSLCRPIQSSDSTTAAGEASISSTPQLLSTWSFGGSGIGLGLGSSTSFTSRCDSCEPPPSLPASGVLTEKWREGEQIFQSLPRDPIDSISFSPLSHLFFSFSFSLSLSRPPLMRLRFRVADAYDPPICSACYILFVA